MGHTRQVSKGATDQNEQNRFQHSKPSSVRVISHLGVRQQGNTNTRVKKAASPLQDCQQLRV